MLQNLVQLEEERLITGSQCGFTKNKLCQMNLISFSNKIIRKVNEENVADIMHLDFSKAFDKVLLDLL